MGWYGKAEASESCFNDGDKEASTSNRSSVFFNKAIDDLWEQATNHSCRRTLFVQIKRFLVRIERYDEHLLPLQPISSSGSRQGPPLFAGGLAVHICTFGTMNGCIVILTFQFNQIGLHVHKLRDVEGPESFRDRNFGIAPCNAANLWYPSMMECLYVA